jgi:hypothetical protein
MKKITLLFGLLIGFNFIAKSQSIEYSNGFINGFNLGYYMVEQIVAANPSYGTQGGQFPTYQSPLTNYGYTGGYVSSNPTVNAIINGTYNMSGSNSPAFAGQVAINDLWATGAFDYLLTNSSNGDYYLGLYHGFQEGTARWVFDRL